ncbi:MAG: UDP-3-O-(3-hydroxymyristoyl)glucosamine N-acyltransferase [Bacteroidia bacterium]|nr:UDP-3-O-(3-hydroxymyristoyl)glucosamine N-acyltransferase [Bacteroidia bacterium]
MRSLLVAELTDFLEGELSGTTTETFTGVSKIDQSIPGSLSFLANDKYEEHIYTTSATVVLVKKDFTPQKELDKTLIRVEDPYLAFCKVLNKYFNPAIAKSGVEPGAVISEKSTLGTNVYIGANTYIDENSTIGNNVKIYPNCHIGSGVTIDDNCLIYANVSIYNDSQIGENTIIHSGAVIGSDGFGHAPQKDGSYVKIPQIGNVVIGKNVEIGSNCSIDRATMGSTVIHDGVRLDNLIQVAHNVEIGAHTVIASQSGISGSTTLGPNCVVGGQVGFAGHITIAKGTKIGAQSGLGRSVTEENTRLFGSPVQPLKDEMRSQIVFRELPQLKEKVEQLEKVINEKNEG